MGLPYEWEEVQEHNQSKRWSIEPGIKGGLKRKFDKVVRSSQTHHSLINLIDWKADIVLSARRLSPDEKKYADDSGVTLIETPIALDAFIFIVHPMNPLKSLTTEQIQQIYTGEATDWNALGWSRDEDLMPIYPFVRNPNSGSQELMDLLVMKDLEYSPELSEYEENLIFTMAGMLDAIASYSNAIGYTVYFYNEQIIRPGDKLKTIGVNGVQPNKQTISNRSYPYTTECMQLSDPIQTGRHDLQSVQWLQTEAGRNAIEKVFLLN